MGPTQQQAKEAKAKAFSSGKQPKARVARYLKSIDSQLMEGPKQVLLLKGIRCSDHMSKVLKDLRSLNAPHAKMLSRNNEVLPFEDYTSLEFLMTKNDASLFALASHNKKRPNNLIMGRTFDHQLLDMMEFGIENYRGLSDLGGVPKKRLGSKPLMLFLGDTWHLDDSMTKTQNFLVDFFRGVPVTKLALSGMDCVMTFAVSGGGGDGGQQPTIHMRTYYMKLKKHPNGGKLPVPYLTQSGPDMDMTMRRTQFAAPDLWKSAMRQPKQNKPRKVKNKSTNVFGETVGRLHLERQDIDQLQGKKSKALRLAEKAAAEEDRAALSSELEREKTQMDDEFRQTHGFDPNEDDE